MVNFSSSFPAAVVRTLLSLLLLAGSLPVTAQAPTWQSARTVAAATAAVGSNTSEVTATATDAAGNVFLAGYFMNTVVLGGTTLTSLGNRDIFVTKFSPASNQFVWAQRAGGTGNDQASALAVSGTSVYVAGLFSSSTAGFGPATLTSAGSTDLFVVKFTDAGSFAWAQRAGGTDLDVVYALAVSGTSVYVAGYFTSPTAGFGATNLTNMGSGDAFVAKLTDMSSTGSFTWAQQAGGSYSDVVTALAVSGTSVYVAGYFASPMATFGNTTLTSSLGTSIGFVAKLTDAGSTGSFTWAQQAGGPNGAETTALAVSGTSVYMVGAFGGLTATFGTTTLTSMGLYDVFVAKLTDAGSTGSFTWAQRAGGVGDDQAFALAVSGTSVYVAGTFNSSTASFGTVTLSTGTYDVFVAKLTDAGSTGSFAWAQRAGGTSYDQASELALNGTSVYVAGNFSSSTATFGTTTITNTNPGSYIGFLAVLTDPTLTATTAAPPCEPLTISPNPAHHTTTLRLPAGSTPMPLTLTDAQGRTVRRYPAPARPATTLDLRGLPAGLYLLREAGQPQRLIVE